MYAVDHPKESIVLNQKEESIFTLRAHLHVCISNSIGPTNSWAGRLAGEIRNV